MRRIEKRKPGEFRMLMHLGSRAGRTREEAQAFTARLNLRRLEKHVARLRRRLYRDMALRKIKLQRRRRDRAARLLRSLA